MAPWPTALAWVLGAGPAWAVPPSRDALVVERTTIPIANALLSEDDGHAFGYGDDVAGNGVPDGWRVRLDSGTVHIRPATEGSTSVVEVAKGTGGQLRGQEIPAEAGQTFVLHGRFDPMGDNSQNGAVGIAFTGAQGMIAWKFREMTAEVDGEGEYEIRATAPAGTTGVFVRWLFFANHPRASTYGVGPLSLERMTAHSTGTPFDAHRVVLVTIETLRADHTSLLGYGRNTTPELVRLGAEGAVFANHHAQAPYTRPSLSSLISSRYPQSLGIADNRRPLADDVNTVSEIFAAHGYVTAGFLAQYVLSPTHGFSQGFHYYNNYRNDEVAGAQVIDDALAWMKAHDADNQFVWIHLFDPHGPYTPAEGYRGRFRDDAIYAADDQRLQFGKDDLPGPMIPKLVIVPGDDRRRDYVADYDASIAYTDAQVGRLARALAAEGGTDTVLLVTADHGESMTDHGRYFCHGSIYENDLHVPMLVWAPGRIPAGTRVASRSDHLDIVPTLADLAGLGSIPGVVGASLRARWADPASSPPRPFTWSTAGKDATLRDSFLADGPLKVILDGAGTLVEAYDLVRDPAEMTNLSSSPEARNLAEQARRWKASALGSDPAPLETPGHMPTTDELEALRALGYIE